MAEFCKYCFKRWVAIPSDKITDDMLVMSEELDYCVSCGELKPVVIEVKDPEWRSKMLKRGGYIGEDIDSKN